MAINVEKTGTYELTFTNTRMITRYDGYRKMYVSRPAPFTLDEWRKITKECSKRKMNPWASVITGGATGAGNVKIIDFDPESRVCVGPGFKVEKLSHTSWTVRGNWRSGFGVDQAFSVSEFRSMLGTVKRMGMSGDAILSTGGRLGKNVIRITANDPVFNNPVKKTWEI